MHGYCKENKDSIFKMSFFISYLKYFFCMINNPFASFWMAGYECSDQLNCFGERVNLLETSGHLNLLEQDYQNLEPFKIKTVRA